MFDASFLIHDDRGVEVVNTDIQFDTADGLATFIAGQNTAPGWVVSIKGEYVASEQLIPVTFGLIKVLGPYFTIAQSGLVITLTRKK